MEVNYSKYENKSIAVLIWNTEKENDAHVYVGKILQVENGFYFSNESKGWQISLDTEQMARIKEVSGEEKEIFLQADYFLPLSMVSLPDDKAGNFENTGLRWHNSK